MRPTWHELETLVRARTSCLGGCRGCAQAAASHQRPHPYRKSSRAQAQRANKAIIFMALPLLPVLRRSAQTGHVAAICRAKSPTQIASVTAFDDCNHAFQHHHSWHPLYLFVGRSLISSSWFLGFEAVSAGSHVTAGSAIRETAGE